MPKRAGVVFAFALLALSCGGDDDSTSSNSSGVPTTAITGTTSSGATETTAPSTDTSSPTTDPPIPPVTPPPGQPAVCSSVSQEALEAVGVPADARTGASSDPNGPLAPYDACGWESDKEVVVRLYYGRDPLEILATVRQLWPDGVEVTGLGADAFFVRVPGDYPESRTSPDQNALYVDSGSSAFSISGNYQLTQEQMTILAQNVLANL